MSANVTCHACRASNVVPDAFLGGIAPCTGCGASLNEGLRLWIRTRSTAAAQGPYGLQQVRELIEQGKVRQSVAFSVDGREWIPGSRMQGLFAPFTAGKPPPKATPRAAPAGVYGAYDDGVEDSTKPCPICAEMIKANAKKCRFCNEWLDSSSDSSMTTTRTRSDRAKPAPTSSAAQTNGMAIAAMVLGLCGAWILALPFGYIAAGQIRDSQGREVGGGYATAGIILGWLGLVATVVWFTVVGSAASRVSW